MKNLPLPRGELQAAHFTIQADTTTFLDDMGAGVFIVLQYIGEGHVALGAAAINGYTKERNNSINHSIVLETV